MSGNTLVLENAELFHEGVGRLCLQLGEALGMEVNANMYVLIGCQLLPALYIYTCRRLIDLSLIAGT